MSKTESSVVMPRTGMLICSPGIDVQIIGRMPFVLNVPHNQSSVKGRTALWKLRSIREIARKNSLHEQRFHLPALRPQFDSIQPVFASRGRVSKRSRLEESRGCVD